MKTAATKGVGAMMVQVILDALTSILALCMLPGNGKPTES